MATALAVGESFGINHRGYFLEQRVENFIGVASVQEVVVEVSGSVNERGLSTVLCPVPLDISKDEAFQNAFGMGRVGGDVEVKVIRLYVSLCGNSTIRVETYCEVKKVDFFTRWFHLPFENAETHFRFDVVDKVVGVDVGWQLCLVPNVDAVIY